MVKRVNGEGVKGERVKGERGKRVKERNDVGTRRLTPFTPSPFTPFLLLPSASHLSEDIDKLHACGGEEWV
jgi:hypothetical protein